MEVDRQIDGELLPNSNGKRKNNLKMLKVIIGIVALLIGVIIWISCSQYVSRIRVIYFSGDGIALVGNARDERWVVNMETGETILRFSNEAGIRAVACGNYAYIRLDEKYKLVALDTNRVIIPFGVYDEIVLLGGNTARVRYDEEIALVNVSDGEILVPFGEFHTIQTSDGRFVVLAYTEITDEIAFRPHWRCFCISCYSNRCSDDFWRCFADTPEECECDDDCACYESCCDSRCDTVEDCVSCDNCRDCFLRRITWEGVLDLETGEMIIPFGEQQIMNPTACGLVTVSTESGRSLIEIETGRVVVCSEEFEDFEVYSEDGVVIVRAEQDGRLRLGLIRLSDGLRLAEPIYNRIFILGSDLVVLSTIDFINGNNQNVLLNTSENRMIRRFSTRMGSRDLGRNFQSISYLSNGIAIVTIHPRYRQHGVVDLVTLEVIVPFTIDEMWGTNLWQIVTPGQNSFPLTSAGLTQQAMRDIPIYNDGLLMVMSHGQRGLFNTLTREWVIPFGGIYNFTVMPLRGGYVAISDPRGWEIISVEEASRRFGR